MKIIIEVENLTIPILIKWPLKIIPTKGYDADIMLYLSRKFKKHPIGIIKNKLSKSFAKEMAYHKWKFIGEIFTYLHDCSIMKVDDVDFVGYRQKVLTPKGVKTIDGIHVRLWIK